MINSPMALPGTSNFTPKSFWQRPEGGWPVRGILMIAIAVFGFWAWGTIVPFVLSTIADTVWLCIYGAVLFAMCDVTFGITGVGKTIRTVARNILQSMARGIARCYTTVDPIGILRNNLDDMIKAKAELNATVERFSGSEEKLKRSIDDQTEQAKHEWALATQAQQFVGTEKDPLKQKEYALKVQTHKEQSGMLITGTKQLQALERETNNLLHNFQDWSLTADAKITRTRNKVDFLSKQREMILDAKSTLSVGQRLLRGKPEQLAMVDMAIEYLADDTARTLGQIREFSRFTNSMLEDDKLESGANAELATKQFAEFSKQLLDDGKQPTAVDLMHLPGLPAAEPVFAPVTSQESEVSYEKLFKQ